MCNQADLSSSGAPTALRLASAKLPVTTEFVTRASLPRVGSSLVERHHTPQDSLPNVTPEVVVEQDTAVQGA